MMPSMLLLLLNMEVIFEKKKTVPTDFVSLDIFIEINFVET